MSAIGHHHPPIRHRALIAGLFSITLASGCATSSVVPSPVKPEPDIKVSVIPRDWIPVARYGRYTLTELSPQAAQQNLLLQVVDVSLPANMHATVGDALRYLLLRSGYALCDGSAAVAALYELPLPAAHRQLGPLSLHDALLTLAGPAWDLRVDDVVRQVCFVRAQGSDVPSASVDMSAIEPTRAAPAAEGEQP